MSVTPNLRLVLGFASLIFILSPLGTALAQPSITAKVDTASATYKLQDQIPVTLRLNNTTARAPAQGDGVVPTSDQIDAANTANNLRITKVILSGRDIYGNRVNIASTSYAAPIINVDDLDYGVPARIGNIAPQTDVAFTFNITIPNDGTLHDTTNPGFTVTVEIEWDIPAGGVGTSTTTSSSNSLISVTPNLQLPSVTCQQNPTTFRGGEVVRFNSFIRNSSFGEQELQSRPMNSTDSDSYRLVTHLTTDPAYGTTSPNNDDYQLFFTDIFGDMGLESPPDGESDIRVVRVLDTPQAVPAYGDPGDPTTERNYTPQPDDGFLDIGETLNIEYDVLVPQNFPGVYFIAGMVDSLSQIAEPLGESPPRESPPREPSALVNDNTFLDPTATKFIISSTGENNSPDVDIVSGTINQSTGALTVAANGFNDLPSVSNMGDVVAFVSFATNLASNGLPTNGRRHIYARMEDPQNGVMSTVLVSQSTTGTIGNGDSYNPKVSANGRFVVFESNATNLVPGDTNGQTDIFVRDLLLNITTRVSVNTAGLQAAGSSLNPSISDNGRFVAFHSNARNLATNPTSTSLWGSFQVYVVDRDRNQNNIFDQPGQIATYLASVNPLNRPANAFTHFARLSGNGAFLSYVSHATNLDPETSLLPHASIYRLPLRKGVPVPSNLEIVSRASGIAGAIANGASYEIAVNRNGRHIAFTSLGSNLVTDDNNDVSDIFVRDYSGASPKTVRVSVSSERAATGTITLLGYAGSGIAPGNIPDNNVVFGDTVTFAGPPPTTLTFGVNALIGPTATASRDNLVNAINQNSGLKIKADNSTPVIPVGLFSISPTAYNPSIFLVSTSPGVAGNGNITTTANMISSGMTGGGTEANDPALPVVGIPFGSSMPSIDASGRFVAFRSVATNLDVYQRNTSAYSIVAPNTSLVNGERIRPLFNGAGNAYIHDRQTDGRSAYDKSGNFGSTRISVNKFGYRTTGLLNVPSSANSHAPSISGNGQYIAFSSDAENNGGIIFGQTNLDPLDRNGYRDIFIHNRRIPSSEQNPPRKQQAIAFGELNSVRFGATNTLQLSAVSNSGLPVTFTSSNSKVAIVRGNVLTIVGAGSTIVSAIQKGDSSWAPASQRRQLKVLKGKQTIKFNPSFALSGGYLLPSFPPRNSSAGLPITYTSSNPKIVQVLNGNIIKIVGRGYVTVTATQRGNANWNAAKPVRRKIGRP